MSTTIPAPEGAHETNLQPTFWRLNLWFALAYCLPAVFVWQLSKPLSGALSFFPSAGLALACLLVYGRRVLPGLLLGAGLFEGFLLLEAPLPWYNSSLIGLAQALGAVVQALALAWLLRRLIGNLLAMRLVQPRLILRFVLLSALGCVLSATVGVSALVQGGLLSSAAFMDVWLSWWVGDTLGVWLLTPLVLPWLLRTDPAWARRLQVAWPLALAGVLLVLSIQVVQDFAAKRQALAALEQTAQRLLFDLEARVGAYRETLRSLQNLVQMNKQLSDSEFQRFTSLVLRAHPGIGALSFNDYVPVGELAAYEQRMRQKTNAPFQARKIAGGQSAQERGDALGAVVIRQIAPLAPNARAVGVDISSEGIRRQAVVTAIRSGDIALTDPVRLVQDNQPVWSSLMLAPVYKDDMGQAGVSGGDDQLLGFAVAVIRINALLEGLASDVMAAGYGFRLRAPGTQSAVYESHADLLFRQGLSQSLRLPGLPGLPDGWQLEVGRLGSYAEPGLLTGRQLGQLGVLAVAGLAQFLMLLLGGRTQAVQEEVDHQTAELRTQAAELERSQAHAQLGSWSLDADGKLEISQQAKAIVGLHGPGPFIPEQLQAAVHPDDVAAWRAVWEQARQGASFDVVHRVLLDGSVRWVRHMGSGALDAQGRLELMHGTLQDVSEIRAVQARWQAVMDSANDAIIVLNPAGRVTYWNQSAQRIFGFDAAAMVGRDLDLIIPPGQRLALHVAHRTFIQGGHGSAAPSTRELTGLRADGSEVELDLTLSAVELHDGVYSVGIVRDITQRKLQERALRQAMREAESAAQAKQDFLAHMSHELRTPMTAVIGLLPLLAQSKLDAQQRGYVDAMTTASKTLMRTLNDILDLSSLRVGALKLRPAPFNLLALVHNVSLMYRSAVEQKGLALHIQTQPGLAQAYLGDAHRLTQVVNNLVGNALKFTKQGEIKLAVATLPAGHELASGLRFAVVDTGIGLSAAQCAKLFKPFSQAEASTQAQYGGTGLGLSICQELVTLMGGHLGVDSVPGQGSTFWFELSLPGSESASLDRYFRPTPAPDAHAGQLDADALQDLSLNDLKARLKALPEARVLVVEDNHVNQMVVAAILNALGVAYEAVDNGALALQRLTATNAQAIDLILMDLHMPVMDGLAASRAIRASSWGQHIPILAMSAAVLEEDRQRALQAGMNGFISKPVDHVELARALLTHLTQGPLEPTPPAAMQTLAAPALPDAPAPLEFSRPGLALEGFDLTALLEPLDGDQALLHEMLAGYGREVHARLQQWQQALDHNNVAQMHALAHSLAGMAPSLGALETARLSRALYNDLRESEVLDPAQVQATMARMRQDLQVLQASGVLPADAFSQDLAV